MNKSYNYLPNNTWSLQIEEVKELQFYVQEVSLPIVSVNEAEINIPGFTLNMPGDKIDYGTVDCTFIMDDECATYKELFDWMKTRKSFTDISVFPMTGTSKIKRTIRFSDCIITNIGTLTMLTTNSDIDYLTCTVTFKINDMDVI